MRYAALVLLVLISGCPTPPARMKPKPVYVDIMAAQAMSCGVRDDGTLWCWGNLGLAIYTKPTQIGSARDWARTFLANRTLCGLKKDGALWCWDLYIPPEGSFERVGTDTWQALATINANQTLTFGLRSDGTLWRWPGVPTSSDPIQFGTDRWKQITAESAFCGLRSDDTLWCAGLGTSDQKDMPTQVGTAKWKVIATGNAATGIQEDGSLWYVWPGDTHQIGTETDWVDVTVAGFYADTCATRADGSLWCWGDNRYGETGTGATPTGERGTVPNRVFGDQKWKRAAMGFGFSCALTTEGRPWCWGRNEYGQLGTGEMGDSLEPMPVAPEKKWSFIAAGWAAACGLLTDGSHWCWGNANRQGWQVPRPLGSDTWEAISGPTYFVECAIRSDHTLWCWNGDYLPSSELPNTRSWPEQIGHDADWSSIATGRSDACGVRMDGSLWCWGENQHGEAGVGTQAIVAEPTRVGSATWLSVGIDEYFSCGIQSDHSLWCWGDNTEAALGDGTLMSRLEPVRIGTDGDWAVVRPSALDTCALKLDGTLWCWGFNGNGELMQGHSNRVMSPAQVGTEHWKTFTISYGGTDGSFSPSQTCGIREDGTLWCWGIPYSLGLFDFSGGAPVVLPPTQVGIRADWTAISTHENLTCGITSDKALWCWGTNTEGQLGNGKAWQLTPQEVLEK